MPQTGSFVWRRAANMLLSVLLLTACGQTIGQTAERAPRLAPLDCSVAPSSPGPETELFGTGDEPTSALVGQGYDGGAGPGLFITARDAFRVYLNGEFVAAAAAPRSPIFVPLTLLPGDNALSVVVAASHGTPAALVQVDELDGSTVSDESWRVSTNPAMGFTHADYDDSGWSLAQDFGTIGELPGCDPTSGFPADSRAHWIGPETGSASSAVLRKVIRIAPIGFGAGTTGGLGAIPTLVQSWDELQALASDPSEPSVILLSEGDHDFRDPRSQQACPSVCSNDSSKPIYTVLVNNETCDAALVDRPRTERILNVTSNKTIVGLGRGALLHGVTIDLGSSQNIIVRNLAIYDVNPDLLEAGDAFTLIQPSQVWLDHCTTKWISDGFTDISADSRNITLSWMHYDGVNDYLCQGEHTDASHIVDSTVTFHHSFFDHVETHSPSCNGSLSRIHLFNNVFSDNLGYAVGSYCGAQVLLEGNTFQRVNTPTDRDTCADKTDLGTIDAPSGSNYYGADVGPHHGGDNMEPHDSVFIPDYAYIVDPPRDTWTETVSRAGAGGPWALPLTLN